MNKRPLGLLAGVVAIAVGLFAVGCGEDSSTASITKAQFVKKANAICAERSKRMTAAYTVFLKENGDIANPTEADYSNLVNEVVVPAMSREIEDLRGLGAPAGDEEEVEALIEARENGLKKSEENPEAITGGGRSLFVEADKLANAYGIEVCAEL